MGYDYDMLLTIDPSRYTRNELQYMLYKLSMDDHHETLNPWYVSRLLFVASMHVDDTFVNEN